MKTKQELDLMNALQILNEVVPEMVSEVVEMAESYKKMATANGEENPGVAVQGLRRIGRKMQDHGRTIENLYFNGLAKF